MEVLVFAEETLMPKDVDFVVDVGDDFFEGVVVELHGGKTWNKVKIITEREGDSIYLGEINSI